MNFREQTPPPTRLFSNKAFPPYSYVPGKTPHPLSHPQGHSYQLPEEVAPAIDLESWNLSPHYLYGFDLFNYGYYWEAHEVWEGVWHANGRTTTIAIFLKGLIKIAAAGVKVREKKPKGVQRHFTRAAECFTEVVATQEEPKQDYLGFSLTSLIETCRKMAVTEQNLTDEDLQNRTKNVPVEVVFEFHLIPQLPLP